jgi:hypothetical protein
MEAFGADSHDSHINCEAIAGVDLADKMSVVFEIHSSGFAAAMAGVAEPHSGIERVARVIENSE